MPNVKDIYAKAGNLHGQAQAILNEFDGKEMPTEKAAEYDRLMDEFDTTYAEAKRAERSEKARGLIEQPANRLPAPTGDEDDAKASPEQEMVLKAYRKAITRGVSALSAEEAKALRADDDEAGGVLLMPEQQVQGLLKAVDNMTPTRQLANVMQVADAQSLGTVTLEADPDDAEWTSELGTGTDDDAMKFGKRALHPHKLAKRIKISKKLLRSYPNVETLVQSRLAYKFAVPQEKAYMTGTGVNQPLGVFALSPDGGISSSRDVSAAATTAIAGDDLIEAKHTLKPQYWAQARWQLHRDVLKAIRKLKDGQGQYLWQPGLSSDLPSTLLEIPYVLNEYAPSSITASQYVAVLGDWNFYWIADSLELEIQILRELYAESGQIGYIGELYSDGMPVLEEAFVRLKMHA